MLLTAGVLVALAWGSTGCGSSSGGEALSRYRPNVADRRPWEWGKGHSTTSQGQTNTVTRVTDVSARKLRRGDRVAIQLMGTGERLEPINEEVDNQGSVSLHLLGPVVIAGLTTSEAEEAIRRAYIDGKIYVKIQVAVVAQEDEYFIWGEVKRPGKYALRRDLTLTRAIGAAGGFTEFARASRIYVTREGKKTRYSYYAIDDGSVKDPLLRPGDNIRVEERPY
jgi:polysaccharide export outer membrane protein